MPISQKYKILFFGTDVFAGTVLRRLHDELNSGLVSKLHAVVKEPKASGRGLKSYTPRLADQLGIPVTMTSYEGLNSIDVHECNIAVAVSFGQLIGPSIISRLAHGGLNVHPSLLPRYRGPAPIHRALLNQDTETGVSVQTLHTEQFDRGRILAQKRVPIAPGTVFTELHKTLANVGSDLLVDTLKRRNFEEDLASPYEPSIAKKIRKEDSFVSFQRDTAEQILVKSRVFDTLWTTVSRVGPGAQAEQVVEKKRILLRDLDRGTLNLETGKYILKEENLVFGTKEGSISMSTLKPAGWTHWQPVSHWLERHGAQFVFD